MRELLKKWACLHKWKLIKEIDYMASGYQRPVNRTHLYCCEVCGKFKKIKF